MNMDALLPQIIPAAVAWAQAQAEHIAQTGEALPEELLAVARQVGVLAPERIRILRVDSVPFPEQALLRQAALQTGMIGFGMAGLTLGYGVFIARRYETVRLLSHEFRHVQQFEALGGIAHFLPVYLQQLVSVGYFAAALEVDARRHEVAGD